MNEVQSLNIPSKISNIWKNSAGAYTKINGIWKNIDSIYTKINGVWKQNS
nr:MAG TPA: SKIP/SNW domain [Caudoviricetes sp.]